MTGELYVLKLGGEVVAGPGLHVIARDIAATAAQGTRWVVVHGGGPQASALQRALGQEPRKVGGRRITDDATLDVIKMTVAGKVNVDLCGSLIAVGLSPVGLHGASALAVEAVKRPPKIISGGGPDPIDLGHVGDVVSSNQALIALLLERGYLPVLSSLGCDRQGRIYNINADTVSNRLAALLGASALVAVSDVPGVLRDVHDPATRMSRLTVAEGKKAIAEGIVTGGMIPKLEESFAALGEGVARIHIVGKLAEGDLVSELREPGSRGTALFP